MTAALRHVGYFRELDRRISSGPTLEDSRSDTPLVQEDRVVAYLRDAPVVMASPELLTDVLDPSVGIGTLAVHSDGEWTWRSDLAYYVERYHVRLDPDFVVHLAARDWSPPAAVGITADDLFD